MKKTKKMLSFVLSMLLIVTMFPTMAFAKEEAKTWKFGELLLKAGDVLGKDTEIKNDAENREIRILSEKTNPDEKKDQKDDKERIKTEKEAVIAAAASWNLKDLTEKAKKAPADYLLKKADSWNGSWIVTKIAETETKDAIEIQIRTYEYAAVTEIQGIPKEIPGTTALTGKAVPENADQKQITWEITDAGMTGAVLDGTNLKVTNAGTVNLLATIKDGKKTGVDFTQEFTVIVKAADYTKVTEALALIPEDMGRYTEESAAAVQKAKEAVKENLEAQLVIVDKKKDELDKLQQQEIDKLEAISGLSAEEAKERLVESLKEEAKTQAQSFINDIMDDAKLTASKEAKRIVIQSIQRVATETAIENSVTVFHIESDEIKGRIIGREGRNIRALEAATGVEIVVDDTPEAIVLSAFDPVRREIARLALHQLVTDGRIHPARIEEVVAKVRKQVEEEIIETGKRTTIDLGIHGLHPELIRIIGKMKYRSSYGQNLLQHARETANLCAVMASELGLNPKKAKRAGLLHDIGKVPDEEPELPHALLGMKLAEKYKEKPDICNAIGAHHDETEMTSLLAPIVQVCDAISGARPGARREIVEAYIKRLNDLEQLAMAYPGVTKTYAIQAGRELRVIVGADKIDDKQTESLSGEIAKKIQDEMTYPGQVKITVIRETRAVSFAK